MDQVEDWLVRRVARAIGSSTELSGFLVELGFEPDSLGSRNDSRIQLDAAMLHLFGIDRADVEHIMETFLIVRRNDEAAHGEYRTKRLILEAFDKLSAGADCGDRDAGPVRRLKDAESEQAWSSCDVR